VTTKICRNCHEERPLTEFYAAKSSADGKQAYCKVCSRGKSAAWESANKDKVRARQAAWRAANPEKVKEKWDTWRAANPEKVKTAAVAWRAANPEKVAAVKEKQRTKKMAARAAWFEANKDAITKPIKTPEEWSQ
jgi:hypothetical protein